jgi:hypothetical protein
VVERTEGQPTRAAKQPGGHQTRERRRPIKTLLIDAVNRSATWQGDPPVEFRWEADHVSPTPELPDIPASDERYNSCITTSQFVLPADIDVQRGLGFGWSSGSKCVLFVVKLRGYELSGQNVYGTRAGAVKNRRWVTSVQSIDDPPHDWQRDLFRRWPAATSQLKTAVQTFHDEQKAREQKAKEKKRQGHGMLWEVRVRTVNQLPLTPPNKKREILTFHSVAASVFL